jgi:hypothetical protein
MVLIKVNEKVELELVKSVLLLISLKWHGAWAVAAKIGLEHVQNMISSHSQLAKMIKNGYFKKSNFNLTWN